MCLIALPGHPKRHLLQSGWSLFVSSKKLVAGDAFIFLRSRICFSQRFALFLICSSHYKHDHEFDWQGFAPPRSHSKISFVDEMESPWVPNKFLDNNLQG